MSSKIPSLLGYWKRFGFILWFKGEYSMKTRGSILSGHLYNLKSPGGLCRRNSLTVQHSVLFLLNENFLIKKEGLWVWSILETHLRAQTLATLDLALGTSHQRSWQLPPNWTKSISAPHYKVGEYERPEWQTTSIIPTLFYSTVIFGPTIVDIVFTSISQPFLTLLTWPL